MHPWQVNIQRRKKRRWIHWCGGTIINNEWILSAAHCFDDFVRSYDGLSAKLNIKDIRVIVGDHDLTKHDEYEKKLDVEYIVKHWNYIDFKRIYNNNDIALLKVKSTGGITFNDYIQPACLPEDLTLLLSETKCEVSGWGKTNFLGEISDKLKVAEVPIIPNHVCQSNYQQYSIDFEKVICAGDTTADTCQGDSGGPLICEINGLSTVIGITSWGKGCGQEESPGVYTKVSEYIRWINDQITNHQLEGCILSDDQRFMYMDMNGVEIKPGERIAIGTSLKAHCRFNDEYSYLTYDYDYYNNDTYTAMDDKTLTCEGDRKMSQIQKQCPEAGKNNECMSIDNGLVAKTKDYYIISCHKGFSSILNEIEDERYNCINGTLRSYITRQEPLCLPDPCPVSYDMDRFLTISDKYRIYLSGGAVVEVGDIVYFNCSMAGNDIHEPVNRRFKCINGMWIEDERDKTWKFGNNGNFPICRKVVCDDECYVNNGECVGPRKCKCPEWKFGTNCELSSCRLPENKNMAKVSTQKTYFAIGETVRTFTCGSGHFPSSDQGMTCRSDGSWSDIITCEKGINKNLYFVLNKKMCPGAYNH
ncbi:uncharacterized protein LOC132738907 isoform X2 [Ruditapes philippinarum]|uniref:uncharacterized protein LOC132738907 isoform X2 n=1 Tax=Ruditapes philippinarum TaxID=129788 RepID=UPI00295ABAEB|nr:uncharacterized protein LOC132738907 isoform X2 [Ruditapes philippinarum]